MPFPESWPPRRPSGVRSLRIFLSGTTTDNYEDTAFMWAEYLANLSPAVPDYAPPTVTNGRTQFGTLSQPDPWNPEWDAGAGRNVQYWSNRFILVNDGSEALEFSFDGTNLHGRVLSTDPPLEFDARHESGIAIKSAGAGLATDFRLFVW